MAMTQEISNLLFFCFFLLSLSPHQENYPLRLWHPGGRESTAPPSCSQLSPLLSHRRGLSGLEEGAGLPFLSCTGEGWREDAFLEQESLNSKRPEVL